MTYAVVGILFVVVVGGLILALTMRATAGSTPATSESSDPTDVGDTPQLSEADEGAPPEPGPVEPGSGRFKRDSIGGEAEAETTIDTQ
ncbi:MAG: hypothetical protein QOI80_2191 [Solirubrobacteraceae bacterium]|jgi:hypothetical protein|nr:hypothetical protein [Solirubrobacteraceae bacterium]